MTERTEIQLEELDTLTPLESRIDILLTNGKTITGVFLGYEQYPAEAYLIFATENKDGFGYEGDTESFEYIQAVYLCQ